MIGKLFFSWDGRIGRKLYWAAIVPVEIGLFLTAVLIGLASPQLGIVASLIWAYPRICVITKRLHDIGRSGWLQVLPNIATNACAMFGKATGNPIFTLLSIAIGVGFLLWMGCAASQSKRNTYGPPPGLPAAVDVF